MKAKPMARIDHISGLNMHRLAVGFCRWHHRPDLAIDQQMIDQQKFQKGRGWAYLTGIFVVCGRRGVEIIRPLRDAMTIGKGKRPRDPNQLANCKVISPANP